MTREELTNFELELVEPGAYESFKDQVGLDDSDIAILATLRAHAGLKVFRKYFNRRAQAVLDQLKYKQNLKPEEAYELRLWQALEMVGLDLDYIPELCHQALDAIRGAPKDAPENNEGDIF